MKRCTYTLSDGLCIEIEHRRSAKKNLILRPVNMQTVGINVPPFLQDHAFFFQAEDGIRDGQFHPAGIVFILRRHLSDGAFFQY
ncbi:hypothetical protein [Neisseria meningitidis]|uniref:hypothetical protein n=1 Tax=Neisseria meningitidis TaxID=487 RepID=UPI0021F18F9C|nr:hypothetical protein [Neisseria meningitidis]MCV6758674.1 hypothetical protein [Neisseria meningitidis]